MLRITPSTLDALAAPHEADYVQRVVARIRVDFPTHYAALGPDRMATEVRALIERGRKHGLNSERDLHRFCCLGVSFGGTFDEDPALPWMASTFNSRILGSPSERLDQAYALAMAALSGQGRPVLPLPRRRG